MTILGTLRSTLLRTLNERQKRALKSRVSEARNWLMRRFRSYDGTALTGSLRRAGIRETDTVMVHANFEPDSGFRGTPVDLVNALAGLLAADGNLLMVSIPFRGTAYDYLVLNKPFSVKKTISMMGLVTEMFRRREGTLRSLHPTHPVLALGRDAARLVGGHDRCLYPCGPGSPFERLLQHDGKILFFDVSFGAITFFHYVEHLLKDRLPFAVYDERLFSVTGIDAQGESRVIQTYTYNKAIPRSAEKLEADMLHRGMVRRGRIGNSRFLWVTAADVLTSFTAMVDAGNYPYEL